MYMKNKTVKYSIRLSEEQMEHLELLEELSGIKKADLIRGYIDRSMSAKIINENRKTNKHD